MCLAWKGRQARLGIDDFGRPLSAGLVAAAAVAPDERTGLLSEGTAEREGSVE